MFNVCPMAIDCRISQTFQHLNAWRAFATGRPSAVVHRLLPSAHGDRCELDGFAIRNGDRINWEACHVGCDACVHSRRRRSSSMVTQWYCRILGDEIQGEERGPVTDEEL